MLLPQYPIPNKPKCSESWNENVQRAYLTGLAHGQGHKDGRRQRTGNQEFSAYAKSFFFRAK